jgi:tRNA(Arg) A34 adenosine deaminase TadA
MDFLRLTLLLALLLFGVAATERSRPVISAQQEVWAVTSWAGEKNYMKHVAGLASGQPASIVVQNGVLLGTGFDRVAEMFDPTAHAETEAIRDACRRAKTTVLKDGVLYTSQKPCNTCMGIIAQAGIRKVFFPSITASRDSSVFFINVSEAVN